MELSLGHDGDAKITVAVIGAGSVGAGLGARIAKAGFAVVYGSRDPTNARIKATVERSGANASAALPGAAAAQADVVIFAVPWLAAIETIETLGDLSGKTIVDVTNPISHAPNGGAVFGLAQSISEYLQAWAPGSHVVKAFNTSNLRTLADPGLVDGPISVPIAGDDARAKAQVVTLAQATGFSPFDVGPLRNARYLESMALLYISMNGQDRPDGFEFYLQPRPNFRVMDTPPQKTT